MIGRIETGTSCGPRALRCLAPAVLAATAATAATACGKPARQPPPADGVVTKLTQRSSTFSNVAYDDQRRTWVLVKPRSPGASTTPDPMLVCRFDGRELACGAIPGTARRGDEHLQTVKLIPPANGAIPHVLVEDATRTQILEPFSWRVVRAFDGVTSYRDELLIWADGTLLLASDQGAFLSRPDEAFRPLPGFPKAEDVTVHVSRWGLVWLEGGTTKDEYTLKAAPFDGFALGPIRSYGHHPYWFRVCRDGDTFGSIAVGETVDDAWVRRVDLASGDIDEVKARDALWLHCRPSEVGAIAIDLRREASARCDRSGCRAHLTPPSREGFVEHQAVLVEGAVLLMSGGLGNDQLVSQRTDGAPRLQRITGGGSFSTPHVVMTTEGALGIYFGGDVIAFDHQGTPIPIEVRWVNSPW